MRKSKIKTEESYRLAFETRNLEIKLFWQRSNYFLVLNSSLAIGFFAVKDPVYALGLSAMGLLVSVLWFFVNLGSKFWQSRWERRLTIMEGAITPKLQFFDADWPTIFSDVRVSLEYEKKKFRKPINWLILKKPSVSLMMIFLSMIFILAWMLLLLRVCFLPINKTQLDQPSITIVHPTTDTISLQQLRSEIIKENSDLRHSIETKIANQDSLINSLIKIQTRKKGLRPNQALKLTE